MPQSKPSALMETYARLPVSFARGVGSWLYDTSGAAYLDAVSGIAVCGLGHAHPEVTAALARQAGTLVHTSNLYRVERQEELGARLAALSGMDRVFFGNSGAEANEAAIKIARKLGHERGHKLPTIVVMEGAFHGRTLATLSATGSRKVQAGFEPLVQGFLRVPYGDVSALTRIAAVEPQVVAVMLEPVQGEGGVQFPPEGYLRQMRELCDAQGWLLMLDEIQTGLGRTGRWFAAQHEQVLPDVMTLAKSLGNGVPIGACLARGAAAEVLQPGNHGSTYGGNPLACSAALAVLDVMERDALPARAAQLGARLLEMLNTRVGGLPGVVELRGRGLMLGIELDRPCTELPRLGLDCGILVNVTAERVVRLLPPLTLSDADADVLVDRVGQLLHGFLG